MIVPAETAGKAKSFAYSKANELGWRLSFTDFRARRAPEFDAQARETEGKFPWCLGWRDGAVAWGCLES